MLFPGGFTPELKGREGPELQSHIKACMDFDNCVLRVWQIGCLSAGSAASRNIAPNFKNGQAFLRDSVVQYDSVPLCCLPTFDICPNQVRTLLRS